MKYTDRDIRNLAPQSKAYKRFVNSNLYIQVSPAGSRTWYARFIHKGKRIVRVLGKHPDISLLDAKGLTTEMSHQIHLGDVPAATKGPNIKLVGMARKSMAMKPGEVVTVEQACRGWIAENINTWSEKHASKIVAALEQHIYPAIGFTALEAVKPGALRTLLISLQTEGKMSLAIDIRQWLDKVFALAMLNELCQRNPAAEIRGLLLRNREVNRAAVELKEAGALLAAVERTQCLELHKCFTLVLSLCALRTNELLNLRWSWFDSEDPKAWTAILVPAEYMKRRLEHLVPLGPPLLEIFQKLHAQHQGGEFVFGKYDSRAKTWKPLHCNVALNVLECAGFQGRQTGHGFRTWFSTWGHEREHLSDAIEFQLAHVPGGNNIKQRYNRAKYLRAREVILSEYNEWLMAERQKALKGDDGERYGGGYDYMKRYGEDAKKAA